MVVKYVFRYGQRRLNNFPIAKLFINNIKGTKIIGKAIIILYINSTKL